MADEPAPPHWDGHRRPCMPGDEVLVPHRHEDGQVYGGDEHLRLESLGEDPRPLPPEAV